MKHVLWQLRPAKGRNKRILFHQRFLSNYDSFTTAFERAANRRLRVRQMEAVTSLTTTNGEVALPADYLVWRTILPNAVTRSPWAELDYVHPAYLPPTTASLGIFPHGCSPSRVAPARRGRSTTRHTYEFHYYQQIPSLVGNNTNSNWLLTEYPDAYLFGVMTEASCARPQSGNGATLQGAARRGAGRNHPAIGADHRRHQPERADSGVFLMPRFMMATATKSPTSCCRQSSKPCSRPARRSRSSITRRRLLRHVLGDKAGSFVLQ